MKPEAEVILLPSTPCTLSDIDWSNCSKWMGKSSLRDFYYQYSVKPTQEKWDFNDFGRQIAQLYFSHPNFPGKAAAYLDAQTALIDIADAEGFKVQTRLNSCRWHSGAIELLARFTHEGSRVDLRMVIDPELYGLERSRGAYTGVCRMETSDQHQHRYETFRHRELAAGFVTMLKDELLNEKADGPMNFCTIMDTP